MERQLESSSREAAREIARLRTKLLELEIGLTMARQENGFDDDNDNGNNDNNDEDDEMDDLLDIGRKSDSSLSNKEFASPAQQQLPPSSTLSSHKSKNFENGEQLPPELTTASTPIRLLPDSSETPTKQQRSPSTQSNHASPEKIL